MFLVRLDDEIPARMQPPLAHRTDRSPTAEHQIRAWPFWVQRRQGEVPECRGHGVHPARHVLDDTRSLLDVLEEKIFAASVLLLCHLLRYPHSKLLRVGIY